MGRHPHHRAGFDRMGEIVNAAAFGDKGVFHGRGDVIDRRRRHAAGEGLQPGRGRCRRERFVEQRLNVIAVAVAVGEGFEARILGPFRMPQDVGQNWPKLLLVAHDVHPAIGGSVELARGQHRMGRARQTVLHHPGVEIPGRQIAGVVQGQIEQAGVNVAAQAGGARGDQRAGQGIGHRQAGHHIDHRQAETGRRRARLAGHRKPARLRLHQIVIARPIAARAGAAIGRQMGANDGRVDLFQTGVIEA